MVGIPVCCVQQNRGSGAVYMCFSFLNGIVGVLASSEAFDIHQLNQDLFVAVKTSCVLRQYQLRVFLLVTFVRLVGKSADEISTAFELES